MKPYMMSTPIRCSDHSEEDNIYKRSGGGANSEWSDIKTTKTPKCSVYR